MDIHSYLLFVGASIVLCIVPGPDMAYILTRAIVQGKKAGVIAAFGVNLGAYVHLLAVTLGLSALLMASSVAFTIVKWIGAVYLIFIGVQAILNSNRLSLNSPVDPGDQFKRTIFWQGFLSDVLNPKVAIFFLAFLPQFVSVNGYNPTLQLVLLGITVNIIGIVTNLILVYFSTIATDRLRKNSAISTWLNKLMGTVFIALGIRLANENV